MRTETYFVIDGKLTIYKTPEACLLYGIDLSKWLALSGTTLQSVRPSAVSGVMLDGEPFIDGTSVCAWVMGLATEAGAENLLTFEFVCADGKSKDSRTIHFKKRPG